MSIFEEVGLTWGEREYVVAPDKVMGLVETIEDIVTIEELAAQGVKRAKVAKAFAAALRYAGAPKVDEQEVYASLFGDDAMASTTRIVYSLLAMMIPPEHLQLKSDSGKPKPPRKKAAKGSSRKRT
jgi:hypothetical protein